MHLSVDQKNEVLEKIRKKSNLPVFYSTIIHNHFFSINNETFKPKNNTRALAVSGIADPRSFYESLQRTNIMMIDKKKKLTWFRGRECPCR